MVGWVGRPAVDRCLFLRRCVHSCGVVLAVIPYPLGIGTARTAGRERWYRQRRPTNNLHLCRGSGADVTAVDPDADPEIVLWKGTFSWKGMLREFLFAAAASLLMWVIAANTNDPQLGDSYCGHCRWSSGPACSLGSAFASSISVTHSRTSGCCTKKASFIDGRSGWRPSTSTT